MSKPVLILSAGGHAVVVAEAMQMRHLEIIGFTDPQKPEGSLLLGHIPVLGDDSVIENYAPDTVQLANGLGGASATRARQALYESYKARGYGFVSVIHDRAYLSPSATLDEGAQVFAHATIQCGASIGENTIINTAASVDHDCTIGRHCHIAPGCTLSGSVDVGEGSHIGTGATIAQGIRIGNGALVGAGAVVIRDVADGETVVGNPARVIRKQTP